MKLFKHFLIKYLFRLNSSSASLFWKTRHKAFPEDYWIKMYNEDRSEHRSLIINFILSLKHNSLFEFGCNSGANISIINKFKKKLNYDGVDINEAAIALAKKNYQNDFTRFHCIDYSQSIDIGFATDHEIFLSIYSLSYLEYECCVNLLKCFKNANFIIIAEPTQKFIRSLYLNRIPEFSHDYDSIMNAAFNNSFVRYEHQLARPKNNLSTVLIYQRQISIVTTN